MPNLAGIKLMRCRPDSDGKFAYAHPLKSLVVTVDNADVAACVEYLFGSMGLGIDPTTTEPGRKLMQWLMDKDVSTYVDVCD